MFDVSISLLFLYTWLTSQIRYNYQVLHILHTMQPADQWINLIKICQTCILVKRALVSNSMPYLKSEWTFFLLKWHELFEIMQNCSPYLFTCMFLMEVLPEEKRCHFFLNKLKVVTFVTLSIRVYTDRNPVIE